MQMQKDQVHLAVPGGEAKSLRPARIASSGNIATAMMAAAIRAIFGGKSASPRKERKPVPMMVCSPAEEIAAHNAAVHERNAKKRSRVNSHRSDRRMDKALADTGQHPKFRRERTHIQHPHQLRDEHGVYTLVGAAYAIERVEPDTNREHVFQSWTHGDDFGYAARRKWLAGISAQRGY